MRIQLLSFGVLRERIPWSEMEIAAGSSVADLLGMLRAELGSRSAREAELLGRIAVSVNAEYARGEWLLKEGDEVGLLPPVSGGNSDEGDGITVMLTWDRIASDAMVSAAKRGSDGAVVVFDGIVRDNTRGRRTLYLDYEAYQDMALKQMRELAVEAQGRFKVRGVTMVHRLGRLEIGETSVLTVVASAHRGAAYEASRWLIDTLKKTVPIWKRETFVDGAVWVDGEPFPAELVAEPAAEAEAQPSAAEWKG